MENNLKRIFLAFIALTALTAQVLPYSIFYRPAPTVVVYHEPIIYHRHEPSFGECAAGFVGACAGFGLVSYFENRSREKKMNKYREMFQDLGYDRAQSKVYAKLAMDNPGGFQAVVQNIEREKESIRHINAQHDLLQSQINAQQKLEELKHNQKLEKITHEHQLNSFSKNNALLLIALLSLIILSFFGGMSYHKRKK
ncbi:MAG: hypothetical protein NTU89_04290 [Candidatus Dependentiae bacterium]|nr:hypothetical protein [Candidatus Dependentiae bacterium]